MKRAFDRDRNGQTALVDGLLFFLIMVIASVLVLVASTTGFRERRVVGDKDLLVLAHEYRDAFFASTIPVATYSDRGGGSVTLYNHTVLDLMLEEISLIDDGVPRENFDGAGSVNERIVALGERLLGPQRFQFGVFATFEQQRLELFPKSVSGRDSIPFDRVTSGVVASLEVVGKQGEATVELYLWT